MLLENSELTEPFDSRENLDISVAFAKLRQQLIQFLMKRVANSHLAEDLVQDIFEKALLSEQQGKEIQNLQAWLFKVAQYRLADHFRSKHSSSKIPCDDLVYDAVEEELIYPEDDDAIYFHAALSDCLEPFIHKLPEKYRDTLLATDLGNETMQAYAERQGLSVSAIKSRASRGRKMVKKQLLDCCQIEFQNGLVSHYHPHEKTACGTNK